MKKLFIVANWKSYKTISESKIWIEQMLGIKNLDIDNKEIILCSSFTLLSDINSLIARNKLPIKLGTQDLSPFGEGAYTGEVNGKQIGELARYVIIGHSERRNIFSETDDLLEKKVEQALKFNLTPIFCIQDKTTFIPKNVSIVAYEPVFAIGTGNPDTPDKANEVSAYVKKTHPIDHVLYGGSVTVGNVSKFTEMPQINGVLVGTSSLKAQEFVKIVDNA